MAQFSASMAKQLSKANKKEIKPSPIEHILGSIKMACEHGYTSLRYETGDLDYSQKAQLKKLGYKVHPDGGYDGEGREDVYELVSWE